MKKILLIGLIINTINLYSQNEKIVYGIKGGINYSNFITKSLSSSNQRTYADLTGGFGYYFGGFASFKLNNKISIQPELILTHRKSNFEIKPVNVFFNQSFFPLGGSLYENNGEIKEFLLLMPVMAKYKLGQKTSVEFGPQFGYSLNREVNYERIIVTENITNDDSEKFELGLGLGFGYSLFNRFEISVRYNYTIIERHNLNPSSIQLGLNYTL